MSQRIGMADGRCITDSVSSRLMNDAIMARNNIAFQDNYSYRTFLQQAAPEVLGLPLKNAACGGPMMSPLVGDN